MKQFKPIKLNNRIENMRDKHLLKMSMTRWNLTDKQIKPQQRREAANNYRELKKDLLELDSVYFFENCDYNQTNEVADEGFVCMETGRFYESMQEAVHETGNKEAQIRAAIIQPGGCTKDGYHWRAIDHKYFPEV